VELGSASTHEQGVAESTFVVDFHRSSFQGSETQIDLEIDLGLLRNDQPILAFVSMPPSNNEPPEKSQSQAANIASHTGARDNDTFVPSSNEFRRDSVSSVPVTKEMTETMRQSSSEDDFYSVYRSTKTKPVAAVEPVETKATSVNEDNASKTVVSSLEDNTSEHSLQTEINNTMPTKVPVGSLPVDNADPLTTRTSDTTEMIDELNILFTNGLTVDIALPPCSLVSGTSSYKMADRWVLMPAPANILCISVSTRYVWCVDHSGRLFYSALHGPGLQWFSVTTATAQQVRVSPSGALIWRIDGGSVYAASGVTAKRQPWGTKWLEVARDVAFISVDETVAW